MSDRTFDRETLLDLSVNAIPIGIIAFFVVAYLVIAPYPNDPAIMVIQMAIMLLTGIGLTILTYYSGKAISTAEDEGVNLHAGYSKQDVETLEELEGEPEGELESGEESPTDEA
ncbi:MAG: hypothetical protein ACI8UR_001371 [Natronomonas sp.]|jgi:hypothetical protein|uniref:DUF6684 family protein n=1 Tax=Natronomonas sp. TaxID=2184060 RepID=UPI003989326C